MASCTGVGGGRSGSGSPDNHACTSHSPRPLTGGPGVECRFNKMPKPHIFVANIPLLLPTTGSEEREVLGV